MVINTVERGVETASNTISLDDIDIQQGYVGQQCFDGYARVVKHRVACKAVFDRLSSTGSRSGSNGGPKYA
jgi:hypothetical protein